MSNFKDHKSHVITHALLITVLPFSPIPLLDWFLEPIIARRMFTPFMKYPNQRRHFIGKGGSFCLGCITSLLLYPFTKLFKILRFFLHFKSFIQTFYYWVYKSYILHEVQTRLTDDVLQDHKRMFTLGQDLDAWLRTSQTVLDVNISQLSSLEAMRNLFKEVTDGGIPSIVVLQDTQVQVLDDWLNAWIEKFNAEA